MPSPRLFAARAPAVFWDETFHGINLKGLPRNNSLHLRVLGFELLGLSEIARIKARVFVFPEPGRIRMNPMLAAKLRCGRTAIELFENRDDLRLGEATFLQERVSLTGLYARKLTTPAGPKSALHVNTEG